MKTAKSMSFWMKQLASKNGSIKNLVSTINFSIVRRAFGKLNIRPEFWGECNNLFILWKWYQRRKISLYRLHHSPYTDCIFYRFYPTRTRILRESFELERADNKIYEAPAVDRVVPVNAMLKERNISEEISGKSIQRWFNSVAKKRGLLFKVNVTLVMERLSNLAASKLDLWYKNLFSKLVDLHQAIKHVSFIFMIFIMH